MVISKRPAEALASCWLPPGPAFLRLSYVNVNSKPSLIRTSVGSPGSPRSPRAAGECTSYTPRTPRDAATPRLASSLDSSTAFIIRYHELAEGNAVDLRCKERWCDRLDSHVLNERPDEGDELAWRHGNFKSQADIGVQHLAEEDPRASAEQGDQPEPKVGPLRAPQQAQQPQQDSLGEVRTPQGQARGNCREISPSP
ncbi:hypothetical protein N2152v2_002381 [Parachlorella kessleri]